MRPIWWRPAARTVVMILGLGMVAGCAARPVPPPAPPPPPPEPTAIILNEGDRLALEGAIKNVTAKRLDELVAWANPDGRTRGAVKILRDGYDARNRPCREFHSIIVQGKLSQHATGFVCRQPDGVWEVIETREYPLSKQPGV